MKRSEEMTGDENFAYVQIKISNLEEATKKAAELVITLEKARDLIKQLNEMELIILNQNPTVT